LRSFGPSTEQWFSDFDDKMYFSGSCPTGNYLLQMHKTMAKEIRPSLDQAMKKVTIDDQISIDVSYKVPKKLARHMGRPMYETLQTAVNGIKQIRMQNLNGCDSP